MCLNPRHNFIKIKELCNVSIQLNDKKKHSSETFNVIIIKSNRKKELRFVLQPL